MLICYSRKKQASAYIPNLLRLMIYLVLNAKLVEPLIFYGTLPCSQQYELLPIPINSNVKVLQIKLQVLTNNTFPVILNIFDTPNNFSSFKGNSIFNFNNIDVDSIEQNKRQQTLYYARDSKLNKQQFYIGLYRFSLGSLSYITNIDRSVQGYNGKNTTLIKLCLTQIQYKITINQIVQSDINGMGVLVPPRRNSQCLYGYFDSITQSCLCYFSYFMSKCDTSIYEINQFAQTFRRYIGNSQSNFYYFEPQSVQFDSKSQLQLQISIKGDQSGIYSYKQDNLNQINVLYCIQQRKKEIKICSIFFQEDPSQINKISLKNDERILLTIYKPRWATGQFYELKISNVSKEIDQFIIIIVCVSVSATVISAILFILWLIYNRKRGNQDMMSRMGIAFPVRNMAADNRVCNFYFPIDSYFPTVAFQQIYQCILSISNNQVKNQATQVISCSICLDTFENKNLVKSTYCYHIFHSKCLSEWILRQASCPLCRQQFTIQSVSKVQFKLGLFGQTCSPIQKYKKLWETKKRIPFPLNSQSITREIQSSQKLQLAAQQQNSA